MKGETKNTLERKHVKHFVLLCGLAQYISHKGTQRMV
jgi:hypothetical protein